MLRGSLEERAARRPFEPELEAVILIGQHIFQKHQAESARLGLIKQETRSLLRVRFGVRSQIRRLVLRQLHDNAVILFQEGGRVMREEFLISV